MTTSAQYAHLHANECAAEALEAVRAGDFEEAAYHTEWARRFRRLAIKIGSTR